MTRPSRLSLRHHVVFIIVLTVGLVIGIHDAAAYRELRRSAIDTASDRLRSVSVQVGDMLDAQAEQVHERLATVARDSAVRLFLRSAAAEPARPATLAAVQPLVGSATSVAAVELLDAMGNVVLRTSSPPELQQSARRDAMTLLAGGDSVAIGPMTVIGDTMMVCAGVAKVADAGKTIGYVVQWRRISGSAKSRQQLIDLIGPGAQIAVGNTAGPGWTDFSRNVDRPTLDLPQSAPVWYERPGAGKRLAVARRVVGTPWTLVIDFSEASVLARVDRLVERLTFVTLLLLWLGVVAAWLLGRRLTTPLGQLAHAAAAISGGDYTRRVAVYGGHEVQALGNAFNTMSESIESARRSLEEHTEELAERADQLSEQAAELEMANDELADSRDDAVRARDQLSASLAETARATAELNASLSSAPVGFAFHDSAGRYRRVNGSLAVLNGIPADDHIGRLPSEVIPALGKSIEASVRRALESDSAVFGVELSGNTPTRPDVVQHWLASFYPIRTVDGEMLGAGSVVVDVTAHKRLEAQLLHSQKMEAVGRLAGGVAHDFNNVLTAISGFGQFALSSLDDSHKEARDDMEQVLAAADRAASLTRQLLAFSRQQVLQPQVLNLNGVVNGLSRMLERLIGEDVRLVAKPARKLSSVKADPSQLEQVLVNLVVNARDAMPDGGSLVIETANVELDAAYTVNHEGVNPGSYVMLAVTDTGIGMDAATRGRAFDPFFTTKPPGKGTGLGLATVYGIVRQSGGTVDIYSEPGHGTTFKVYLPRCDDLADRRRTPAPVAVVAPGARRTVLLVDDDAFVAATARRTLERAGYHVLTASNGRLALGVAETHRGPLDLLVTDLVMPEMGGRELARRVVARMPSLRVLYTSGYTAEAMNQQAVLDPRDAFLGKPFTPDALLRAVQAAIDPVLFKNVG